MSSVGTCSNVEHCGKAAAGELIDLYPGFGEVCPECGRRLVPAGEAAAIGAAAAAAPPAPMRAPVQPLAAEAPVATAEPSVTLEERVEPALGPALSAQAMGAQPSPAPSVVKSTRSSTVFVSIVAVGLVVAGLVYFAFFRSGDRTGGAAAQTAADVAGPAAFRVCGSSTTMDRLVPDLTHGFLKTMGATSLDDSGGTVSGRIPGTRGTSGIALASMDAAKAFRGLSDGTCQIAVVGQQMSAAERVSGKGSIAQTTLGLDGVVIVVNPSNPVAQLSLDQVAKIFTGAIQNWSAVGGQNVPIEIVVPAESNDEMIAFKKLVLSGASVAGSSRRVDALSDVSAAVGHDRAAIGVVGFNASDPARVLRLTGDGGAAIVASSLNIGQKHYPLTMPIYLYSSPRKSNSLAAKFIAYTQSESGQAIVTGTNFVGRNSF